ncbi:MAG TPA: PHP domain-containing protein [Bacilli bacterium]
MKADLHTHTNYSDGKLSVCELLNLAQSHNISIVSITDHDTFAGVKEALSLNKDIRIIIGIELSTVRNGENVHLLGYFKNLELIEKLQPVLDQQVIRRHERAYKILDKLKNHFNIILDPKFINEVESITRGTIAREIIKQGYDYSSTYIFDHIIGEGCPAYIPSSKMQTSDGIKLIKECGGLVVLAHPRHLENNNPQDIIDLGIDGIEAIYPLQDEEYFRNLAMKNKLFITAGTDFHELNDDRHGNVGDKYLEGEDLNTFLKVLYES